MVFEFKFPDVGEGIEEGKIVKWLVSQGEEVAQDVPIVHVETDKAVVELPSPTSGTVLTLHFAVGDIVHVGDVILTLGELREATGDPTILKSESEPKSSEKIEATGNPRTEKPASGTMNTARPLATPHTRALARKLIVDLAEVKGSGRKGRITDEDVERAAGSDGRAEAFGAREKVRSVETTMKRDDVVEPIGFIANMEERVPISRLRQVIAESMDNSVRTAAHVTHLDETDVTDLIALKKRLAEKTSASGGPKLTLLPFFIRALVAQLKMHPKFNASHDPLRNELVLKRYYNIGIAVDTPEGLIVPVIKAADQKNLSQLALESSDLAQKAKDRSLGLQEIQGGTCTLTNIGSVGGLVATPIIRQPELAVVAFMQVKRRPVVRGDDIVARSMMYVGVSFDHRFIDGAEAARFTGDLCETLSSPDLLITRM